MLPTCPNCWVKVEKDAFIRPRPDTRSIYEVSLYDLSLHPVRWSLCNKRTFHHLLYLHYFILFSVHSHCFCSIGIYFLHVAFMILLLVFMSFHFNFKSFHFDDPRSGMFNPMSVKRILNAKGTAFTWMLSTREQLYFITLVPSSTSACTQNKSSKSCFFFFSCN